MKLEMYHRPATQVSISQASEGSLAFACLTFHGHMETILDSFKLRD